MEIVVAILSGLFLMAGSFFAVTGGIGVVRMPDFYSRLHPAGKLDTMGILMTMIGVALYNLEDFSLGSILTSLKIILIVAFLFITSPTATHAIVDAGVRAGLGPWTKEEKTEENDLAT